MACPGGVHREEPPHFVLVPLLAPGHMIPMVDMARLLAAHGAVVSVAITPVNAARIGDVIRRCADSGLPVHFIELPFPCREVGLPEGCENLDLLPSRSLFPNFHRAARTLLEPLEQQLRRSRPAPSCVVSDSAFPWTRELARSFGVPWLLFHGFCCFALLCQHNLHEHKTHLHVASDSDPFVLPCLGQRIEVTRAQLPGAFSSTLKIQDIREQIRNGELTADGFVVNTFAELEPAFVHDLQEATGKKVWTVGPLSLCNKKALDVAERGDKASIDNARCLKWLDSMDPGSVVYASFGSIARLAPSQLKEIGLGLEASGHPFIWVIKTRDEKASREVERWLEEEGFEERNRTKGLLIRGWAPQLLILSHPAVGGFLTHCGWNSTLEGVCAGVPMVSWPLFGEQFLNEKLIGQILGVAVGVGVYTPIVWTEEEKAEVLVRRDEVARAVASLMHGGEEAAERRRRARELGEKARRAVVEGGSSHTNVALLIRSVSVSSPVVADGTLPLRSSGVRSTLTLDYDSSPP
ncbi:hypothetical protein Taro_031354 [Colocasia esculenta]|uniref:Glycosyltransferase n=1 Tax=Colocasia esculenta TaxID=4460 RepID=A0A843VPT7_COLES|nr:hypothetical protein [Colocasia esculenta]